MWRRPPRSSQMPLSGCRQRSHDDGGEAGDPTPLVPGELAAALDIFARGGNNGAIDVELKLVPRLRCPMCTGAEPR